MELLGETGLVGDWAPLPEVPDMTPAFSYQAVPLPHRTPMGIDRQYPLDARNSWSPELRSTSLLPSSIRAIYLDRWLHELACTAISNFRGEIAQMWVVPVDMPSATLVGDVEGAAAVPSSSGELALAAAADLQSWLGIGQDDVAHLAGYSPRSTKNWRDGMAPYPATVRRLFEIHALVGSLTRHLGSDGVLVWLADAAPDGRPRRDLLGEDDGLRTVASEAATLLFERPAPDVRTTQMEEPDGPVSPPRPELFTGPVRRARRYR